MLKIDLKFDNGIPQYYCSSCSKCNSVFGTSLCSVKNRGCCWYFPKFTLHEIHKMAKSEEGLNILKKIVSIPNVKIYNYYIHAIGAFDKIAYKKYLGTKQLDGFDVKDKTIFFRTCPFVKQGVGCTIPKKYRSYVCNFFICDEVVNKFKNDDVFKTYIKQRNSYVRWIEWENASNKMLLENKKLTLADDFDEVIKLFKNVPLELYEVEKLPTLNVLAE